MIENLERKIDLIKELQKLFAVVINETPLLEIIKKLDLDEYKRANISEKKFEEKAAEFINAIKSSKDMQQNLDELYELYNIIEDCMSHAADFYGVISSPKYVSLAIFNTTETRSLSIQKLITKINETNTALKKSILEEDYNEFFPLIFSTFSQELTSADDKKRAKNLDKIKEKILKFLKKRSNFLTIWFVKKLSSIYSYDKELKNIVEKMKDKELMIERDDDNIDDEKNIISIDDIPFIDGLVPITKAIPKEKMLKNIKNIIDSDLKINVIQINLSYSSQEKRNNYELDFFISPLFTTAAAVDLPINKEVIDVTTTIIKLPPNEENDNKKQKKSLKNDKTNNNFNIINFIKWHKSHPKTLIIETLPNNFSRILSKIMYPNYGQKDIDNLNKKGLIAAAVDTIIAEEFFKRKRLRPAAFNKIIEDEFLSRAENTKFSYLIDIYEKRKIEDVNTSMIKQNILSELSSYFKTADYKKIKSKNQEENSSFDKNIIIKEIVPREKLVTLLSNVLFKKTDEKNIEYSLTIIRKNRVLINEFCREFCFHFMKSKISLSSENEKSIIGFLEDSANYAFEVLDSAPSMWKSAEYSLKEFIMENRFNI